MGNGHTSNSNSSYRKDPKPETKPAGALQPIRIDSAKAIWELIDASLPFKCSPCGRTFGTEAEETAHDCLNYGPVVTGPFELSWKCGFCTFTHTRKRDMGAHVRLVHGIAGKSGFALYFSK
jgi:hypothetical protein